MSIGIGDVWLAFQLLWLTIRHPHSVAIYWSIRRRLSGRRLRAQTRFLHRAISHRSRDFVVHKLDIYAEFSEYNQQIVDELIEGSTRIGTAGEKEKPRLQKIAMDRAKDMQARASQRIKIQIEYLDTLKRDTQVECTAALQEVSSALSTLLSAWMPGTCRASVFQLFREDEVLRSHEFRAFQNRHPYKGNAKKLFDEIGGELDEAPQRPRAVAYARGRCINCRQDRSAYPPWRIVTSTTPFDELILAGRNDPSGRGKLYQHPHTNPSKKRQSLPNSGYRDPSMEASLYQAVVAVPLRGAALGVEGDWGFLWLESPIAHAFARMFRYSTVDEEWTSGLHLLHAIADSLVSVLACEAMLIAQADRAKTELRQALDFFGPPSPDESG